MVAIVFVSVLASVTQQHATGGVLARFPFVVYGAVNVVGTTTLSKYYYHYYYQH